MEVSDENVERLREMGFMNDTENRRALRLCNNDVSNAVNWLLTNNDASTLSVSTDPPRQEATRGGPFSPHEFHKPELLPSDDDNTAERRDTDAYAAGFPTQNLFELEGRVFTESWSIPYKRNESLGRCLVAATQFATVNFLDADPDCSRFVQRCLPECYRKLLSTSAVLGWQSETLDGIVDMLELLVELVAKRLRYLPVQHELLASLALAFRTDTEYQSKSRTRRARERSEWLTRLRATLSDKEKEKDKDKDKDKAGATHPVADVFAYTPTQYRDAYGVLVNLINEFGAHGGFGALQSILLQTIAAGTQSDSGAASTASATTSASTANKASIFDLAVLIAPFANCFEFLTPFAVRDYVAPLVVYAQSLVATSSKTAQSSSQLQSQVQSQSQVPPEVKLNVSVLEHALKDKRAHLVFDLLRTLKLVALKLRAAPNDLQAAFASVGDVRTLVECNFDRLRLDLCLLMLRSEHFNARMNTLKELERFIDVLQNGASRTNGGSASSSSPSNSGTSSSAGNSSVVLTGVASSMAVSSLEKVAQISAAEFEAWLAEHRVIELLILEGNLDQQQYLDKIKTVVEYMSTRLSVGEIEQIWNLQFQTQSMLDNVFSLLAIAAAKFSETQFDHLYSLIQSSWHASSVSPAASATSLDFEYDFQVKEKLIMMLSKIARETKDSKIVLKLLQILWDLAFVHTRPHVALPTEPAGEATEEAMATSTTTMTASATASTLRDAASVAKRRAFLERLILLILNEHLAVLNESSSVREATRRSYAVKCIENIKTGAHYVAPSINQLIQIMRSIAKTAYKPEKMVLQDMNNQHEIVRLVINSLVKLPKDLDASNGRIAPDLVVDGLCTLFDSLKIHLEFLRYVLKEGELYLTCMRATELFDCLILRFHTPPPPPVCRSPDASAALSSADSALQSSASLPPSAARPDSLQIGAISTKTDTASASSKPFAPARGSLATRGNTDFIQDLAADWFRVSISDLEPDTQNSLFKKNFAALNYKQLTVKGFLMFRDYFEKVNLNFKKLRQAVATGPLAAGSTSFSGASGPLASSGDANSAKYVVERNDLLGLDFIWQLALNTENMTVARGAIHLLLNVSFNCLAPRLRRGATDLHTRFIQDCEQRMLQEASFKRLAASASGSWKPEASAAKSESEGALEKAVRAATVCLAAPVAGCTPISAVRSAMSSIAALVESDEDGSLTRIERLLLIVEQYIVRVEDEFESGYAREHNASADSVFVRRFPAHTVTFYGHPFAVRVHVAHDSGSPVAPSAVASAYTGNGNAGDSNPSAACSLQRSVSLADACGRCEFVLQCHTNDTVASLYRRVAAHLKVPVAAVQLSVAGPQGKDKEREKERYASGASSTLQRDKTCKDRPLPNCRCNRLLLDTLVLPPAGRSAMLNVRVSPSASACTLAGAAVASAANGSAAFYSLELEKQLPSVLMAQDSHMFELLFQLVALQHSGTLRNLHRLIRRLPSNPNVYKRICTLLDSLLSGSSNSDAMEVDGESRFAPLHAYVKSLLDVQTLSLFQLAYNLETLSAVLMPTLSLPGSSDCPLGSAATDMCNADVFTVSDSFTRTFVQAGCVQLLVKLLEHDWLTERGFRKAAGTWTQQRTEYELLLHVFLITLQLLRFLLVGHTPLQPLAVSSAEEEESSAQVILSSNEWSHLFTVLLRLAWHTALRETVLISADEKASQSPTSGSAMQHAEVANSGVSTRVVQFGNAMFCSHRVRQHLDAGYLHRLVCMHAFSLLLSVVLKRDRSSYLKLHSANESEQGAACLLRVLYAVPCLSQWLLQLLVECPNSGVRAFVASCLFQFCDSYERLPEQQTHDTLPSNGESKPAQAVQRPKHFLLRLLLSAHLPFWNTTVMLRSREKQRLLAQSYDYFTLRANLLSNLSKRDQTLMNVACAQLLKDECDWLVNFLPGIPNSFDATASDAPTHGIVLLNSKFLSVEECLLTGHLEALHALLTCEGVDKRATGERLIALLLTDCLFPASSLLLTAEQLAQRNVLLSEKNAAERERALLDALQSFLPCTSGSQCSTPSNNALHFLPKARSALARSRCLQLIDELCRGCVENLQRATQCLLELHHTVDRKVLEACASGDSGGRAVAQFDAFEVYNDWDYSFPVQERNTKGWSGSADGKESSCAVSSDGAEDDSSRSTCDDLIGLRNGGATCYMNSILQQLFMQPGVCEYLLQLNTDLLEDGNILFQVQQLFAYLKHALFEFYAPRQFWHYFRWNYSMTQSINIREQQDAYDFLTSLIDQLDLQLEKLHRDEIFKLHYQGSFTDLKECEGGCSHRFEREQDFYGLNLSVKTGSLLDALKEFVQVETLEGANAYYCEFCNEKRRTRKRMLISKLPEVLTMQLKRFDYDWDAQKSIKFNDYFAFPFRLNMKPFTTASISPVATEGAAAPCASADDDPEFAYELVGIVIHSGMQANAGHYYSFIKDRRGGSRDANAHYGRWYKFNDTCVEQFDAFDEARAARAGPGYIDAALEHECFGGSFKQTFAAPPPPPSVAKTSSSSSSSSSLAASASASEPSADSNFKRPRLDSASTDPAADSDFDDELHDAALRYEEGNSLIQNIFKNASLSSFAMSNYAQPGSMTSLSVSTSSVTSLSGSNDERVRYWNAYLLFYERVLKKPPSAPLHPVLTPSKRKSSVALVTPYQGQFGSLSTIPQHPFANTPTPPPATHRYSSASLAAGALTPSGAAARRLFVPSNSALASPHGPAQPLLLSNATPPLPQQANATATPPVLHTSHVSPLSAARARSMSTSTVPYSEDAAAPYASAVAEQGPSAGSQPSQPRASRNSSSFIELTRLVSLSEDNELGLPGSYAHHALGSVATTPFADNISIMTGTGQQMLHPFEVRNLYTPFHRWSHIASKRIRLQLLLDNLLFFRQRAVFCKEYFRFARLLVQLNAPANLLQLHTDEALQNDDVARVACQFALQFVTNAFYRVHKRLRDGESDSWKQLLHNLVQNSKAACTFSVQFLSQNHTLTVSPGQLISTFLLRCPQQQVRSHFAGLLESLLLAALTHMSTDSLDLLVSAHLEPLENGELAANVTRSASYLLVFYNFLTSRTSDQQRLQTAAVLTRHSAFSRLANFLVLASTGLNVSASQDSASLSSANSTATSLRKAMSRDQIREFNGYLFAVLSQLLVQYDCSPTPTSTPTPSFADSSNLLRVHELDANAGRWLALGAAQHSGGNTLLNEALLFAREHYCTTAHSSVSVGTSFPVALQTVAVQLLDALAHVSAQNSRFAEQLIATTLQQLDAVAAVADINTLLHVLEREVSMIESQDSDNSKVTDVQMELGDEDKTTNTPWRVLAIVDGKLDCSEIANGQDSAKRLSGLLQIVQNEHEKDTRKAYLCIKFLVQQAQRCDAIRFYLTHPADRWEWCCNWLRTLMTHGLDGVAETRRSSTSAAAVNSAVAPLGSAAGSSTGTGSGSGSGSGSTSTALVPYKEPNGAAPSIASAQAPLGRSINYGTFQRTMSASVTLQDAMDMMSDPNESASSEKLEPIKQDEVLN